jgi:hypothetical protein
MNVGDSIRLAIDDWMRDEFDAAMLHACNAVDGTASKRYSQNANNVRFTRLIRENYSIFGPMGAPGIDFEATRWPVSLPHPKAPGGGADIADIIYGVHRCSHGHGDELPDGFELLADAAGPHRHTRMQIKRGKVQLSDRVIFGLLAIAVMAPENADQRVPDGYHLTFAGERFPINDWWGRAVDFEAVVARESLPRVKLDFSTWAGQY